MNCPPLVYGLPYTCDPMTTFLVYMIPVAVIVLVGIGFSVMLLALMARERRMDAAAVEDTQPTPATAYAIRQARRASKRVELVARGTGDKRTTKVKTERAIASVLDEVDR